jgi:hypothetical protein
MIKEFPLAPAANAWDRMLRVPMRFRPLIATR